MTPQQRVVIFCELRERANLDASNKVEYPVVGAFAVSWHGFPRYSGDIDFLLRPTLENATLVLNAIAQFGFGSLKISPDLATPGKVGGRTALLRNKDSTGRAKELIDAAKLRKQDRLNS